MERQKHKWIGWGWDETICEHCRVNVYNDLQVRLHTEYCDELPPTSAERSSLLEHLKNVEGKKIEEALRQARTVLSEEQWRLLKIPHEYKRRDYMLVKG